MGSDALARAGDDRCCWLVDHSEKRSDEAIQETQGSIASPRRE
jgi:hypothetical protein